MSHRSYSTACEYQAIPGYIVWKKYYCSLLNHISIIVKKIKSSSIYDIVLEILVLFYGRYKMSQSQILYINFRNSEAWISQLCILFMIGLVSLCHLYFHESSNIIFLISSKGEASLLIGMYIKSEDQFLECACAPPKSGSWVWLFPLNASFISFSDTFFPL